jgi:hypothetical protein
MHSRRHPNFIADQMIQLQTSWMVLQIPNVRSVILITQDDGVTDQKEMSNNDSDDA